MALTFGALCAPTSAHAADPVLVAVGDIACNPESEKYNGGLGTLTPEPGECHQKHTSDLVEPIDPLHVLALGDLQYEDGAISRFQISYDDSWGRPGIKEKTKPVPGNHEYGAGHAAGNPPDWIDADPTAEGYFTYFADELAAEGDDAGDPQRGWYSYDVPVGGTKWHVVAINSECSSGLRVEVGWDGDCDVGSEQEQWLRADLAADRSDCTLAYWHHPRFSSSPRGDEPVMAPIWNALYEDYADIVLAGHEHDYERFAQANAAGARAPGRGIRSWIVGTGGKSMGFFLPAPIPITDVRNNNTHGILKLTLHGPAVGHPRGWYQWQFVNDGMSASTFTDSGSGDCVGPAAPAPAARPAAASPRDALAPRLSLVKLSRKRFRVGRRGILIGFTLSEPATATFRIDRKRKGRLRRVGTFKRKAAKGRKRVRFRGRIGKRKLRPGLYRLTITLTDQAGNRSRPKRLFFRILK